MTLRRNGAAARARSQGRFGALFIVAFALGAARSATAAPETFDLATFEPPPGWERTASSDVLLFRAAAGDAQIALRASFATEMPPARNFQVEWDQLVTAVLGPVDAQIATEETADGWTAVMGAANVTRAGATIVIFQVTTTGFGRAMTISAQLVGADRAGEVTAFLESIELRPGSPPTASAEGELRESRSPTTTRTTDAPSPLVIAPAGFVNDRPAGLFYRLRVGALSGSRTELETRVFLPGERITRMFPYGGGDAFDSSRCIPDSCGTYSLDGADLVVRWDDGRTDRWPFARTADGISLDGTAFRAARPVSGAALVGEWSGAQSAGNPFANVYRFEPDGSFTFGAAGSSLSGRYRVQGLTLTLDFADGTQSRRTLFAAGTGQSVDLIGVDGDVFVRR